MVVTAVEALLSQNRRNDRQNTLSVHERSGRVGAVILPPDCPTWLAEHGGDPGTTHKHEP